MRTRSLWTYVSLTGVLGLVVSIYAGLETLDASLRNTCSFSSYISCGAVDSSGRTTVLGIPDAAIGISGFILIIALAVLAERRSADLRYLYALLGLTTIGVAFAAYFAYVEVALIHALCPVCVTSYIFGVLVWVGAIALTLRMRAEAESPAPKAADNAT